MAAKKKPTAKKPVQTPRVAAVASVREPRDVTGWRAECERLKSELDDARAQIVELRARQDHVLNRIDWVLDSLDSLADNAT